MVGSVAAPVPLLASAAGEVVDHSTLQFLLNHAIEMQKVLEEEERRKNVQEAVARLRPKVRVGEPLEHEAWCGSSSSSAGKRRKKKKRRRKRKTPKT